MNQVQKRPKPGADLHLKPGLTRLTHTPSRLRAGVGALNRGKKRPSPTIEAQEEISMTTRTYNPDEFQKAETRRH